MCAHVLLDRERSGVFALGLPIVVIGVSFNDAFREVDQWKAQQAFEKAERRCVSMALRALSMHSSRSERPLARLRCAQESCRRAGFRRPDKAGIRRPDSRLR